MIKIMQVNLGRSRAAHDIMFEEAFAENASLVIVSEPNKIIAKGSKWETDLESDVAVYFPNRNLVVDKTFKGRGFVALEVNTLLLIASYVSPNIDQGAFEEKIDGLFDLARRSVSSRIIFAGDINAKSPMWGAPSADHRRSYVESWMAQLDWTSVNNGNPTFVRGECKSHIDVTLCSPQVARLLQNWTIKYSNPYTEHGVVTFNFTGGVPGGGPIGSGRKFFCPRRFGELLGRFKECRPNDITYEALVEMARESTSVTVDGGARHPYW